MHFECSVSDDDDRMISLWDNTEIATLSFVA